MGKPHSIAFGKIGRPHGIKGQWRFFPYNPHSPVLRTLKTGVLVRGERRLPVQIDAIGGHDERRLLRVREVSDRNAASEWTNAQLWVDASVFPDVEDDATWYEWQLVGLAARNAKGESVGVVRAIENYGAGDIVVVRTPRGDVDVPFMAPWVGDVDLETSTIMVDVHWLERK